MIDELKNTMISTDEVEEKEMPDYFTEDGKVDKYKYMLTLNSLTKTDLKHKRKIVKKFFEKTDNEYYRLNILGTDMGCVFHIEKDLLQDENYIKDITKEINNVIESCVMEIKAYDFNNSNDYNSLEIWGVNDKGEGVILFLFPYDEAVICL